MNKGKKLIYINRELSWLGFNERVLQEAADKRNPLIERFRFLGIFSNNMDEFYRVRVASVRRLVKLKGKIDSELNYDPQELLSEIQKNYASLQRKFESEYENLLQIAKKEGIEIINEKEASTEQIAEIKDYFEKVVEPNMVPIMINKGEPFPELKDRRIYLAVSLYNKKERDLGKYAILEVPSKILPRFKVLEPKNGKQFIILLDDIIRMHLKDVFAIFDYKVMKAYTIKMTRDSELDMDTDDLSASVTEQLTSGITGRKKGSAVRFTYDRDMPEEFKDFIFKKLKLKEGENVVRGGRYHNFKDFIGFPSLGLRKLVFNPLPPIENASIYGRSVLSCIRKKDILLNFPYENFNTVIDLLREAAIDPEVKEIKINLYRVAKNSRIINALINAAKNGKEVTVVVELLARFDEENNILISNKLNDEGVKVIFGVPGLKVHSKLILISRKEKGKIRNYAHIGTGNFHEGNAKIYTDCSLLTANPKISDEVAKLFEFFMHNYKVKRYSHLINSPVGNRRKFLSMIQREINNAKAKKKARIILKLNNLVDEEMVNKLYDASKAGVKVDLIIRGICSLVPGEKGLSENINVISIVDRFLEHSRVLYFENGGDYQIYISSADWMTRNLDRRVEVSVPIYDEDHKKTLKEILDIHLRDNVKSRTLKQGKYNSYIKTGEDKHQSQLEVYKFLKKLNAKGAQEA